MSAGTVEKSEMIRIGPWMEVSCDPADPNNIMQLALGRNGGHGRVTVLPPLGASVHM